MIEVESIMTFFHLFVGVFLTSSASSILNQFIEVKLDAKMLRTKSRPLPTKKLNIKIALYSGLFLAVMGVLVGPDYDQMNYPAKKD